ncbi:MAG: L,D-transpeptidase [Thermoanaerobaculia bacterium]|nr:MAG: L,D-transpeptidase [Thermoanaerobaculia bacterium]MBZ0102249.1 L,D-transpeptidase [Thermoanaerobaculia bacterium]
MIVPPDSQAVVPRAGPSLPFEGVAMAPRRLPAALRALLFALAGAAVVSVAGAIGLATFGGSYERDPFAARAIAVDPELEAEEALRRAERAEQRLAAQAPGREVYVVVDSYANRLRIFKNGELVRDALCSTGSGVRLRDPRNGKEWVFDTPQGELKILRKVKDPVWVKPDWAFIEEGYEPPRSMRDRVDDFSLGDYGLYMRDGYIIHGTIFKTLLGKRVTHGCIRLGDEDLEFAYKTVPAGARVFLF